MKRWFDPYGLFDYHIMRMRRPLLFCLALLICTLPAISSHAKGMVREGDKLPPIILRDIAGKQVYVHKLCDMKAKKGEDCVIVINIFKIICPPCEVELPHLIRFQKDWAERGVIMVMVAHGEKEADVQKYAAEKGLDGMNVLVDRYGKILVNQLKLGKKVPRTLVIDSNRSIISIITGGTNKIYDELSEKMAALL